jgi:hypothetical protein
MGKQYHDSHKRHENTMLFARNLHKERINTTLLNHIAFLCRTAY